MIEREREDELYVFQKRNHATELTRAEEGKIDPYIILTFSSSGTDSGFVFPHLPSQPQSDGFSTSYGSAINTRQTCGVGIGTVRSLSNKPL